MSHFVELHFPDRETAAPKTFGELPIWACGFRPFFFGGALLAALSISLWLFVFFGGVQMGGAAGPMGWHIHEMIFGFTTAIIAGFLLTAVPKWTRTPTISGAKLAAIFGLWFAGRVAMAVAAVIPYWVVFAVDFLFLPVLAVAISIPIIRSRTPRNLGFVPLLTGLAAANALFHLNILGVLSTGSLAVDAGLGIIIVIISIIGGRVIPFFTVSRLGHAPLKSYRIIEWGAVALTVAWLVSLLIWPTSMATGVLALIAGAANLIRMHSWGSFRSFGVPLLWILHIGYAFVGLGLILFGLATLEIATTRSVALHALTTGAIGLLCLGMMARVALGHSGRALQAHKVTVAAFILVVAAAAVRVFVPWLAPAFYTTAVITSGILWTAAWVLFLVIYTPIFFRRRADGRPG